MNNHVARKANITRRPLSRTMCLVAAAAWTLFPAAGNSDPREATEQIVHRLSLTDPVFPTQPARHYQVTQSKDANGFPRGYALSFLTQVCTDQKCKTVEATLHWDALGYYERYEYPPGKPLTKKEHVPFVEEDYAKLDRILKDRDSILGRQSLAFLAHPAENADGIDGWSGATPQTVQDAVIQDAAYTTWVMWQWANGEIVPKLCQLTEQSCTPDYLKHLLRSADRRAVDFALKHIARHERADSQFLDEVFHVLEHGDREHVTLALELLSRAMTDKEALHNRLIESCCRMKSTYSPLVLAHFAAQRDLPASTLEGLTAQLGRLPYFQVHLILRLLEERQFHSEQTEADVVRLLSGDDFFIARRASEFLMKQDLADETQAAVDAFRERHRDRL